MTRRSLLVSPFLLLMACGGDAGPDTGIVPTEQDAPPYCGNGVVDPGELCDDGGTEGGDGCASDCMSDETCGNGVVDGAAGELCDDGGTEAGDGCSAACRLEYCGNGVVDEGELCDDGGTAAGDGCASDCMSDETCGNGVVDVAAGELCDDGGTEAGDGCSATCGLESCGDGKLDAGEACDDGNNVAGDGCASDCASDETCGNGYRDAWEACDDGDTEGGDGCAADCGSDETCGNGVLDAALGEICDDGRVDGTGFCNKYCMPGVNPAVAATSSGTCALRVDGSVKCWGRVLGYGDFAARGDGPGEMGSALPAIDLGTGRHAVQISAGSQHVCAVLDDATLKCWGSGSVAQLGLGDSSTRGDQPGEMGDALPTVDLGTGRTVVQVAAGFHHTCALLDDATVKCWGRNTFGQLGAGDLASRGDQPGEMGDALTPIDLGAGLIPVRVVTSGTHVCVLSSEGAVKCWGSNIVGELGLGDTEPRGDAPGEMGDALPFVELGTGRSAVDLVAGHNHSCVILDDDTVKCWGGDELGWDVGFGDGMFRGGNAGDMGDALPALDLGAGRVAVTLGARAHRCAVFDDGALKCWGDNSVGALGVGPGYAFLGDEPGELGDALPVVDLGAGRTVLGLELGFQFTCVLLDGFDIKCWGRNHEGQLGLGDTDDRGDEDGEMGDALPIVDLGP